MGRAKDMRPAAHWEEGGDDQTIGAVLMAKGTPLRIRLAQHAEQPILGEFRPEQLG